MILIDFLLGKNKPIPPKKMDNPRIEAHQEYDRIKMQTEILQAENRQLDKEFNNTIASREKALQFEKEGKLFEALEIYLDSINKDENSDKLTIMHLILTG